MSKKIIIDPGHSGSNPGAIKIYNIKKSNFEINKYVDNKSKELGIPVKQTRESDIDLKPSNKT